ncbi:MAG: helix-turn-helix transcriptional regulator [Lacunisphaera sp.]
MSTEKEKADLLQGTLDMLILKALQLEPMHGFGLAQRLKQMSAEVFQVEMGSLYPALVRLEKQAWIKGEWGTSDANVRRGTIPSPPPAANSSRRRRRSGRSSRARSTRCSRQPE